MKGVTSFRPAFLSHDQVSVFCYQLALMQKAGISSEEGLSFLLEDAGTDWEKALFQHLRDGLAEGLSLSEAMKKTGVFSDYLLRMVEIGQASGQLDKVLEALSQYYRRESETLSAVKRAIAYPALMAVLIMLVFMVLMVRVLPVFQQVFGELGMSLPQAAGALLRFGGISRAMAVVLLVLLSLCTVSALFLFRTVRGTLLLRKLSHIFRNSASSRLLDRCRFASAMSLMLSSGLPLDEAIERTAHLLEGTALENPIKSCREKMNTGMSFPQAVESTGIFSGIQAGLLAAGFRTGASDQAMEELSRRCQNEAEERMGRLLGRFEFGLVIILCLSVGLVLLSVMLPLLGVMSSIGI